MAGQTGTAAFGVPRQTRLGGPGDRTSVQWNNPDEGTTTGGPYLAVGEIRTGLLRHSATLPREGVARLLELVAGERRWRAAKLASLATIPALVRAREDSASLELALIENMVREDLNPVEEARACAALGEELGLTR